jgi:hypothetical protein
LLIVPPWRCSRRRRETLAGKEVGERVVMTLVESR